MAEPIVNFILGKLADATVQEYLHLCGVDEQVKLVCGELGWIQAFLKDADKMQNIGDERQKHWVREVREVAYDIEDAIDKACLLGIEMDKEPSKMGFVMRMVKRPKKLTVIHELGDEINEILERIKKITESRVRYGTNNLGEDCTEKQRELPVKRLLVPDFDDPDVVGFQQDTDNIVNMLLDDRIRRRCVISIVGPGGLGKTTLARKTYNSDVVKKKFGLRMLIAISQKFELLDILRKLVEQLRDKPIELSERGQQAEYFLSELYKSLLGKKYLVVLDDVWTTNIWVQIEEAFPSTNNGSRVLMTSRSLDVAKSADSSREPYKLQFLTENPSLELFLRKALPNQGSDIGYPYDLLDLAKQFMQKCAGLPLALVVLGGLLSKQPSNCNAWRKVIQKMNWRADASKVIITSYDELPFALKSCFMYFALFPEDCQISAKSLIRMWVAEGFIPLEDNGETLEDTAEHFLEDLVQRSMVQVLYRNGDGSILRCYVHDLLHDIAIRKAKEDKFLIVSSNKGDQQSCRGARRIALYYKMHSGEEIKDASTNIRSLLCFDGIPNCSRYQHLKVLSDMENYWSKERTESYEVSAPLRYLQLTTQPHFKNLAYLNFLRPLISNSPHLMMTYLIIYGLSKL